MQVDVQDATTVEKLILIKKINTQSCNRNLNI